MKIIGLTGGIGSGKSLVSKVFETMGIPVYNSDIEAKKLNNNNEIIKKGLKKRFGENIYINDRLDKKKLASIIFSNNEDLNFVNTLIHPIVKLHFNDWVKKQKGIYVIKETAILFEAGIYIDVDMIISVLASEQIRIKRIVERDRLSKEEIESRMNKQTNDDERIKRSDFLISNNEDILLLPQILNIHKSICEKL